MLFVNKKHDRRKRRELRTSFLLPSPASAAALPPRLRHPANGALSRRSFPSLKTMLIKWHQLLLLVSLLFASILFTGIPMLSRVSSLMKPDVSEGNARRVKHTRLFLGEAAGKGVAGRVQCEGLRGVVGHKTETTDDSCSFLPTENQISFVTFLVPPKTVSLQSDEDAGSDGKFEFGNSTIRKVDRPYLILNIFLDSIQISNPGSMMTLITDNESAISTAKISANVYLYRTHDSFARANLMLERLQSYCIFLGEILLKMQANKVSFKHIIFMDADIIVLENLQCLFETYTDFDIALTFRNNKDQPINSGVLMIRGEIESISRARIFLEDVVKTYKTRFTKATRMLGDQLSLVALIREHAKDIDARFKKPTIFKALISDTRVLFLPSQEYNWTPSEGAGQFHGMPETVKILHFKGSRKRLMIEAWNLFKHKKRSILDMKCLILMSGRAKYDF